MRDTESSRRRIANTASAILSARRDFELSLDSGEREALVRSPGTYRKPPIRYDDDGEAS